jgi:ATP-dependent Lon protease
LKTVILPKRNESDLEELPEEVRSELSFVTVDRIDEAIAEAFADRSGDETAEDKESTPPAIGSGGECDTDLTPLAC